MKIINYLVGPLQIQVELYLQSGFGSVFQHQVGIFRSEQFPKALLGLNYCAINKSISKHTQGSKVQKR